MDNDQSQELEAQGPGGFKFRARGYDFLSLAVAILSCVTFVLIYQHLIETKESNGKLADAIQNLARSQREMACIIALPIERRAEQLSGSSFCKQLSSMSRVDIDQYLRYTRLRLSLTPVGANVDPVGVDFPITPVNAYGLRH